MSARSQLAGRAAATTAGDERWLPVSPCGPSCVSTRAAQDRVGPLLAAGRLIALVSVVLTASLALPVSMALTPARRWRLTRVLARTALAAIGVRHTMTGPPPPPGALLVANHISWLDVPVLLAHAQLRLLAKREVRSWPLFGALAASLGTIFIDRSRPRLLPAAVAEVAAALARSDVVVVFPEGTTWCGRAGGRFRPALFQAAVEADAAVVPARVGFRLADGTPTTVAAFVGTDSLVNSLLRVVRVRGLHVAVRTFPAMWPAPDSVPGAARRQLARTVEDVVRVINVRPAPGRGGEPRSMRRGARHRVGCRHEP